MASKHILVKVSVNCFIKQGDKLLLVKQARPEHVRGKWSVPGGKVDEGESFDEAVKREIKEEVGLHAVSITHLGIIHERPEKTVKHIFAVKVKNGKPRTRKDELLDAQWFTLKEIKKMKMQSLLRGEWIDEAIKRYLSSSQPRKLLS